MVAGTHPDLTWVNPTGAHVMRGGDVDEAVVAGAHRTPFEASRRVFVLEHADTMNDEVANPLLKTLEEPADFVHLILLTDALGQVIETVVSRCQLVRFDPLSAERIAAALERDGMDPAARGRVRAAGARQRRAGTLPGLRRGRRAARRRRRLVRARWRASGARRPAEPWRGLLERAEARRAQAEETVARARAERLETEPKGRDRRRSSASSRRPPSATAAARAPRCSTWASSSRRWRFRDLLCLAEGADGAALAADRAAGLAGAARGRDPRRLREAVERCEDVRQSLELNVSEDLALTALTLRLERLVGSAD